MAEKLYKPLLIDSLTAKVDLPKQVFVDFEGNICTAGKKVKYIRGTDIYTPFLVGPDAGYLISNVV